jgi:photosystem II stability/assembly factor-like uncharacterized protein
MLPNTNFLTLGISDIAFAPSNPNTVYLATGDDNGSGTGNFVKYTIGLMKSTDSGQTWEPTYIQYEQEELNLISTVLVDPRDEDVLIVSTDHGIFRSTNGAETFEHVVTSGNFRDMEFVPNNPNRIIATTFNRSNGGGISFFTSSDNGVTWTGRQAVSGAVRAELAVSPAQPNKVWAIVAEQGSNAYHSTWYSEDFGENWVQLEEADGENNYLGWRDGDDNRGQGWYDLSIDVDPVMTNQVVIGGVNLWKSNNSGQSFELETHYNGGYDRPDIHADQHDIVYSKDGLYYLVANDGGLRRYNESTDTYENLAFGLPITQFYKIGVSQSESGLFSGGTQDNGTFLHDQDNWFRIGGADGMETAIDPSNPDIRYRSIQFGRFDITLNAGQRWETMFSPTIAEREYGYEEDGPWTTPFIIDPKSPNTIFIAMTQVWRSDDRGADGSWRRISDFNVSQEFNDLAIPDNGNLLYAARGGALIVSPDDGSNWQSVFSRGQELMDIAVHPTDSLIVGLAYSGFSENDKVYIVDNGEVINISGNLPNVPVNAIVFDPEDPQRIYVGNDIGVFTSYGRSGIWSRYGGNMLNTVVSELEIHKNDRLLYAATYGTGIWSIPLLENCVPNQTLTILDQDIINICPTDSIFVDIDFPGTLIWSDGFEGNTRYLREEGRYSVAASNDYCADYSSPIVIEHNEVASISITAFRRTICGADSVQLNATAGFDNYRWSNGMTGRRIWVKEGGDYTVEIDNPNGCISRSSSISVDKYEVPERPVVKVLSINDTVAVISTTTVGESYRWLRDGTLISEGDDNTIEVLLTGEYSVEVLTGEGCSTERSEPVPIIITSVIWESNISQGKSYPNPAVEEIILEGKFDRQNEQYKIFSNSGQLVGEGKVFTTDNTAKIAIQPLLTGQYYIVLGSGESQTLYTFIKQAD